MVKFNWRQVSEFFPATSEWDGSIPIVMDLVESCAMAPDQVLMAKEAQEADGTDPRQHRATARLIWLDQQVYMAETYRKIPKGLTGQERDWMIKTLLHRAQVLGEQGRIMPTAK
jgi:hypothetical protein